MFKSFICDAGKDYTSLDLCEVETALLILKKFNGLAGFHCEDYDMIQKLEKEKLAEGKLSAKDYLDSRPVEAELIATKNVIAIAEKTGSRIHICHVSHPLVAEEIRKSGAQLVFVGITSPLKEYIVENFQKEQHLIKGRIYLLACKILWGDALHYILDLKNGRTAKQKFHPHDLFDHFDEQWEKDLEAGYEPIAQGDTIEELAEKAGIDVAGLVEQVEQYNDMCAEGYDELFEKERQYMQPIEKGPFYCCRQHVGAYGSVGGILINHKTQVMTENYNVIEGLFAAGSDACNIFGDSYPFILSGNTMGFCLNSGRIAGENATANLVEEDEEDFS